MRMLLLLLLSSMGQSPAATAAAAAAAGPAAVVAMEESLPPESDLALLPPESFRARFRVVAEGSEREVELWRSGVDRSLVRFLSPGDEGKFLVRHGETTWLIAPGAKKPVRLGPAMKLHGAGPLEMLASTAYGRDHVVTSRREAEENGRAVVIYELSPRASSQAKSGRRTTYVVDADSRLPLRIETRVASGKMASILELHDWSAGERRIARRLSLRDMLRKSEPVTVELLEIEPREIPGAMFDLENPSERAKLGNAQPIPSPAPAGRPTLPR